MLRREHDGRQNDHPVCAASVASRHFLMAQPPLLTRRGLNLESHNSRLRTLQSSIFDLQSPLDFNPDFQCRISNPHFFLRLQSPTSPSAAPPPSPHESAHSKQATVCHRSKTAAPKSSSHDHRLLRRSPNRQRCPRGEDPFPKIHPHGPMRRSTYPARPSRHAVRLGSRPERLRTDASPCESFPETRREIPS